MTTRCKLDASREARLWFGQVIAPTLMVAAGLLTIPEVRELVRNSIKTANQKSKIKINSLKRKLKKEEEPN